MRNVLLTTKSSGLKIKYKRFPSTHLMYVHHWLYRTEKKNILISAHLFIFWSKRLFIFRVLDAIVGVEATG